ncbi:iron hydrogenase small subunit [Anaerospora sp.]|uniref:iron hydrogenase small subunit n=1 Tax=Anaerospora sp. TaxID=1960278 RepID=UPI00289958DD|nr:iron hydrogenase small subunit [Anaerospora sp.]
MAGLYQADRRLTIRKSHENPAVKALYDEYLGKPLSHKSHELLHTHYHPRHK